MNSEWSLEVYLRLFRGREDHFAEQGQDGYHPVHRAFDEFYLRQHLDGDATYGLYVLNRSSCCHFLCIDVDIPKSQIAGVNIADRLGKYGYLRGKLQAVLETLHLKLGVPPESMLLEETGGRGYHVWIFFTDPLDGKVAVRFGQVIKKCLDFDVEFFPKQGSLADEHSLGNLIKLPLGLHRKYGSHSVFFSLREASPSLIDGLKANLEHLASIVPLDPRSIARTVEAFGPLAPAPDYTPPELQNAGAPRPQFEGDPTTLLTRCDALRNLRAKAERGEPFTRSEAFHFANAMLSVPRGVDCIHETLRLCFGRTYDRARTQEEIEKIVPLHPTSCSALVALTICPDYCKESVRIRNEDPLAPNT